MTSCPGAQGWESFVLRIGSSMIGERFADKHMEAAANAGFY